LWPANYLWWSIKARGFYEATLCLTLACALIVLHLGQDNPSRRRQWRDWAILGLLAGIAWWQSPQVVYVLAPAGVWLIVVRGSEVWRALVAIPTFAIGASPWLVANLNSSFASLSPPPAAVKGTYLNHLGTFIRDGLPMTFGLKYVYRTDWIGAPHVGFLLYLAGIALVVIGCSRRQAGSLLMGLIIVSYPFIHALLTLSSEVAEGRYTLFLMPWLALALARATQRRAATAVLVGVVILVSLVGLRDLRGQTSPYAPDRRVPTSMASLERSLAAHSVTRVWANYWIAYRLTFETRERIIGASQSEIRYPAYDTAVIGSHDPAFVFMTRSRDPGRFSRWLQARRVRYDEWGVDNTWIVFIPHAKVVPADVPSVIL
jgi:hypothetical protein